MKLALFAIFALLLVGCGGTSADTSSAPGDAQSGKKGGKGGANKGPLAVRTAKVESREVHRVVESIGTFFPFDEVVVSAEIDGKVEKVNSDLGDTVAANQVLVQISDEEQRYILQQNEAQLRQALERLGLANENDRVADILQTPEVRRAKADLTDAEQRLQRQRSLAEQGIGSRSDLDAAQTRQQSLQAAYETTVNQTRNSVQEVQRVRAVVELQRKKLRDTNVRAPFTGQVKDRQVTQGQFVRANAPLYTLVKIDPLRLRIEIPERMAPWTKNGQMVAVEVEAFPERKFTGKIWRVSPTVDQTKRTFVVEALIGNPRSELKPGSYAKATIATQKVDTVNVVPERAVAYILGVNKAFVIKDGVVESRDLKIGDRIDGTVEILEGLAAGETVATSQTQRLDTGVEVTLATGADDADTPGGGGRKGGGAGKTGKKSSATSGAPEKSVSGEPSNSGSGKRGGKKKGV
jgi:RND family efflux transporter MFP subunit